MKVRGDARSIYHTHMATLMGDYESQLTTTRQGDIQEELAQLLLTKLWQQTHSCRSSMTLSDAHYYTLLHSRNIVNITFREYMTEDGKACDELRSHRHHSIKFDACDRWAPWNAYFFLLNPSGYNFCWEKRICPNIQNDGREPPRAEEYFSLPCGVLSLFGPNMGIERCGLPLLIRRRFRHSDVVRGLSLVSSQICSGNARSTLIWLVLHQVFAVFLQI